MTGEKEFREDARRALDRHVDQAAPFTGGYLVAFVVRVLPAELLAELVAGLDAARPLRWTDTGSGPGTEDRR
ncbi:hypothetical protein [Kribbella solani]|uniref:Uncharacterized protein n=1 Tax=Kribbella solani TaxID=236067 RepID=A0A841E297_9ACTN|nr:hypothetical protein [Kribbella solani]MBB5981508.1 hypothetical protein [Kribbella solani]